MLILWCQGRGLEQEIGNVETGGGVVTGWGHTLGMLISGGGGGGAGSKTDMAIWGMFILWGVGEFWDRHWTC